MALDLRIDGGTVVFPWGEATCSLGITNGHIAFIGSEQPPAETVIDATGLNVLPGVIDAQVHFREPGLTHKEDIESGTRGAVLGGVTTVLEMPNTNPNTTTPQTLENKLALAADRAWTNIQFFMGASAENAHLLGELETLPGCAGVKLFMGSSTGTLLVDESTALEQVFAHGRRRMCVHAEDETRLKERRHLAEAEGHPRAHSVWRDAESGLIATKRALALAEKYRHPVHILHVTTAEEATLLAKHKRWASMEVLPQHLTLTAPECYERLGTLAQMNPPIREAHHQAALWKALQDGVVDVIGSDHAPHTLEEKAKPYPQSPSGMTSVQTLLPIMLNHVHEGRLSLARLVDLVCANPARLFELHGKGRITIGADADLTLVDLKAQRTITNREMASKVGWTPYDGMTVTGWPVLTVVGGVIRMREDELQNPPEKSMATAMAPC